MNNMDVSFETNSAFTNEWLQQGYPDLGLYDPSSDYANDFDLYSPVWDEKPLGQLGGESSYQSPTATFSDSDDYFTLNHNHAITPRIEDTPALSPTRSTHTFSDGVPSPTELPKRKRGRPRASARKESISSATYHDSPASKSTRTPHNQVERKYREGLNAEMERLRLAIPATARWENGSGAGSPKPSKAMVLACAIDYIKDIERQRDLLLRENSLLRR